MRCVKLAAAFIVLAGYATGACFAQGPTLKAVKDRGALACGVSQGIVGFSAQTQSSEWEGFDVDFCRALAAAIFNDRNKIKFVPLSANDRFRALRSGEIDVLSRNSTWTMSRELDGVQFAAVMYYDGQGFMTPKARNIMSALDLGGSKVCVQSGTTTASNLIDYFGSNGVAFEPIVSVTLDEVVKAYDAGRCNVLTSDVSQLHAMRLNLGKPADHIILPDLISKEPLGPAVRQDDPQWLNIVKWTAFALVNAEELGVTSKNIDQALNSSKPEVQRLLGKTEHFGEQMGLTSDWAERILRLVGNYGEIYERNVGVKSELGIPRGINERWDAGGIMYAPPIR
jgi:general L-amino acid transport system substrate-binding protein